MKSFIDVIWYLLLGLFLFMIGVAYQWHFGKHPQSPFSVVGTTLDDAKDNLAETLRMLGLRKPSYYYQTSLTADDNFVEPSKTQPGLTLLTAAGNDAMLEAKIVEPDGDVVQRWYIDWFEIWPDAEHVPDTFIPKQKPGTHIHGAVVMDNGDLVFNFEYQGLIRLDVCGNTVWRLPYLTHHSIYTDPDSGNLWVSGKRFHEEPVDRLPNHRPPFAESTVLEVSPEGDILQEISLFDVLTKNDLEGLLLLKDFSKIVQSDSVTTGDTLHLNDVEVFPSHLPAGHFKPGDIMVSLRNIHTVLVFDPGTQEVTFIKTGDVIGQHDPDFIDGNTIAVFDNHIASAPDTGQQSRVVMLKAPEGTADVYYEGTESAPFYTDIMGKQQWLANGNLLLTESTKGRAFEIDPAGEIVWQHVNLLDEKGWVGLVDEAQRLPESFDPLFFEQQRNICAVSS